MSWAEVHQGAERPLPDIPLSRQVRESPDRSGVLEAAQPRSESAASCASGHLKSETPTIVDAARTFVACERDAREKGVRLTRCRIEREGGPSAAPRFLWPSAIQPAFQILRVNVDHAAKRAVNSRSGKNEIDSTIGKN